MSYLGGGAEKGGVRPPCLGRGGSEEAGSPSITPVKT